MNSNNEVPSNHLFEAETSAPSGPTANEPRNEAITDVQTMNSSMQDEPKDVDNNIESVSAVDNNIESVSADFSALSIAGPSTQSPVSKTNIQPTAPNSSSGPAPTDKAKPNQTSINNDNNESHKDVYLLKPVYVAHYATLMRQSLKIILQNEFGPCGLIAICKFILFKSLQYCAILL
ncbi:hypothetical protein BKA69DRAFT_879074 [Paraphysoderma sedebokerense]|nr:hypothetical protein BKA69DRAFT_879074 [Paraphysoderma sedebokerense]